MREHGFDQGLIELVHRLHYTSVGASLDARVALLVSESVTFETSELTAAVRAHHWFLNRAEDCPIPLTTAGYLKPDDVRAASELVPAMGDWPGTNNREINCAPQLHFRESQQSMGLLRKHKGTLVLTRAGAKAQADPAALCDHLAARLLPGGDDFEAIATLLLLVCAGTSSGSDLSLDLAIKALTELGWRHGDGRPVKDHELYRLSAFGVLRNISDQPIDHRRRGRVSPAAATLARAALRAAR